MINNFDPEIIEELKSRRLSEDYIKTLASYIARHIDELEYPTLMFEDAPTEIQPGLVEVFNLAKIEYPFGSYWNCCFNILRNRYDLL